MINSASEQQYAGGEVLLQIKGELATIFLGSSEEQLVMFSEHRLISLARALQDVLKHGAKGLVIIGPHDQMFCAGTDIKDLASVSHSKNAEELSRQVQELFEQIASLPIITVAAISGSCLGGGTELALACKYRLATGLPSTKIGLPEIQLGILPSFGGTQRLPRLIGLRKALEIILQGKVLSSDQAFRVGLIDQVIVNKGVSPYAALKQAASELAMGRITLARYRPSLRERMLTYSAAGRHFVIKNAQMEIDRRGKGHYPAPNRALAAINIGLKSGIKAGFEEEAKAMGELVVSNECKSLLHIYTLRENSKRIGKPLLEEVKSAKVGIVGNGAMGEAVALSSLVNGNQVIMLESNAQVRHRIQYSLEQAMIKKFGMQGTALDEAKQRLSVVDKFGGLAAADIVIEVVNENSEIKKTVFSEIVAAVRRDTIIASNTPSQALSDFVQSVDNPGRIIGLHFFHPLSRINLVEIVRATKTSTKTLVYTSAFATHLGKFPIIVEDRPGFVVNRILGAYFAEAQFLLSEGYSVTSIDNAAESFGMPMGPFRLIDELGLDVTNLFLKQLSNVYGERLSGPDFLQTLLDKGRLGRTCGMGFYRYHNDEFIADPHLEQNLGIRKRNDFNPAISKYLEDRLVLPMVNEAIRILDEGVAGVSGRDAAGQIDLASVLGFGFAPFRGGILRYADAIGADKLEEFLDNFSHNVGERYKPCSGILDRASRGWSFYRGL